MLSRKSCFYSNLIILFLFIFNFNALTQQESRNLEDKNLEKEISLETLLIDKIGLSYLEGKKIEDFTRGKTSKLSFNDASALYVLLCKNKKEKVRLKSSVLQRMYFLCSDSRLAEYILWELGTLNERMNKNAAAYECFNIFKKLFPGSSFYWKVRLKEIENLFKLNLDYRLDNSNNNILIDLCRQYEYDTSSFKEDEKDDYCKVLKIMKYCYINEIKKCIYIAKDYYNRSRYIRIPDSLFSIAQRFDDLLHLLKESSLYDACSENYSFNGNYDEIISFLTKKIDLFFINTNLKIPKGKDYIFEREDAIKILSDNFSKISEMSYDVIDSIIKKLKDF